MRLKLANLFLGLLLLVWCSIVYIFITSSTYSNNAFEDSNDKIQNQIDILERDIQEQSKVQKNIIYKTQKFLELKQNGNLVESVAAELKNVKFPVLVFACNRVTVTKCLDKLIEYRTDPERFPIIVSQDCQHEETRDAILSYGSQLTLIEQPDQSEISVAPKEKKFRGYFKISRHYGWALNQMFFNFNHSAVIIVEDDLEISPDFYEYFSATYPLLLKDPSLWCISAWNDNGKKSLVDVDRPDLLYRTDFFPGLGWMLTKNVWLELYTKWPRSYWDDWIRDGAQRKDRSCIRPEISRTRTFGKIGVSNGMFFDKHLKYIILNDKYVPFSKMDLSYLLKENYDKDFVSNVYNSPLVSTEDLKTDKVTVTGPVRIQYEKAGDYKIITKKFGLMDDFRGGVPRTAYRGIVTFHYKGRTVHLAPDINWKGYVPTWS